MASEVRPGNSQHERIIKVASRLFAQRGYEATNLKDIAASCNFTHAAIYSYYKSKMAILEEIFDRMVTRFQEQLDATEKAHLPPQERLELVIRTHVAMLLVDRDMSAVFLSEQSSLSPRWQKKVHAVLIEYTHRVRSIYEEGIAAGEFLDIDVRVAANSILGMLNSTIRWYRPGQGRLPVDVVADEIVKLLSNGFRATT
jgi:TetR/AcrR family transcriptional regulator, cholesterol catabolism regulator